MIPIFDTHAHYDDEAFDGDRELLLSSLQAGGVDRVVNVGASLASCEKTIVLMQKYGFVYGALGVHPSETATLDEEDLAWLGKACAHPKCVAVGEIGLDYHWEDPDPGIQKKWFVEQLELARELSLGVVIHSRDAAKDTVDIMKAEHAGDIGGVLHCYSYTKETARSFLEMGFYFGIGGVLTFKNARKLREAVEYIPLDRIVLETDCPYLAPEPYRGRRNSSLNLPLVAQALADVKGIPEEEVRRATWENAHELYRLELPGSCGE